MTIGKKEIEDAAKDILGVTTLAVTDFQISIVTLDNTPQPAEADITISWTGADGEKKQVIRLNQGDLHKLMRQKELSPERTLREALRLQLENHTK